jgi:hypothetical protein
MNDRGHVQLNEFQFLFQFGFAGEIAANPNAGVDRDCIHRAACGFNSAPEFFHTFVAREICLYSTHVRSDLLNFRSSRFDFLTARCQQQIIAVLREHTRQFQTDAARSSCNHCKFAVAVRLTMNLS